MGQLALVVRRRYQHEEGDDDDLTSSRPINVPSAQPPSLHLPRVYPSHLNDVGHLFSHGCRRDRSHHTLDRSIIEPPPAAERFPTRITAVHFGRRWNSSKLLRDFERGQ